MDNKTICIYLKISYGMIVPICAILIFLNWYGFSVYNTAIGYTAIALGGVSTAVAGIYAARYSGKIRGHREVLRDFFALKQPMGYYVVILLFFLLVFGERIINGRWQEDMGWLSLPGLFASAILFGGIEEIGWRYLLQPILEKRLSFFLASCAIFVLWGIWHIAYFVVDGSIWRMTAGNLLLFLLGLLGNTFVLGAVYRITQSLWLCVFYHTLLNTLSQALMPVEILGTLIITILSVMLSILFVCRISLSTS